MIDTGPSEQPRQASFATARGADLPDEHLIGQRRQAGRNLQSVRERLTSASGLERSFDRQLDTRLAASMAGPHALAMVGLGLLVALAKAVLIGPTLALTWGLGFLVLTMLIFMMARGATRRAEPLGPRARQAVAIMLALKGCIWAALVLICLSVSASGGQSFVTGALLVYCAILVMSAYTAPTLVYMTLAPIAAALIASLWFDRSIHTLTFSSVGLAGIGFLCFLTNRLHQQAIATLEFRAEKDILIAKLETATINSEEARRKAEEANLAKSKFLATMSHELRTPLNAILGFSEVMKNEVFGPHASPAYRDYAGDIHGSGQHLLNLINEILDLSRIESGRYELKEEGINLAWIADECCHMLTLRAKGKSQTLRQAVEPDLPRIWADERAIRQIILNLLTNAIKFTPQGGDVMLKVGWTAAGGQYVSVTDNGPGIPESELQSVLTSFGRGSQAIKTAEEGSGLGLPIVKGLVEMHGGVFTLKSRLRIGTEVAFTIPATRVMDSLPAVPQPHAAAARASA
jgi:two-component system, cell cycle sensor histidine kinase PleC